ncbi:AAA family ATPase [Streptacidiphilus sp. EB103A]|uniref:ATP-binding protein n=1 Tax=Streptacidiphilus sp. EB103A TaxID=3156275 RepID=UPI003512CA60
MLHVSLLGQQAITDVTTGTVRTRSSRSIALVAFLVTHAGSPQTRQRIAGLFWPESTDAQALTNLRRELHHLRHLLGDEPALVVTPRDLCWCETRTCRVDVLVFDSERRAALAAAAAEDSEGVLVHATTAVAQYRGELLPGMYDDWLLGARSELERQCVDLCDLICATRARRGDLTGAVDAARHRIRLQPLEEVGYRTLMQLQADLGDRAGALSTYHHCASVLDRELGIVPDPATQQAIQRLTARVDPTDTRLPTLRPTVSRSGFAAAQLVGRSRELGMLQDLWRTAAAGRPGLALVRGGAGVGKTRLVAEVAEAARLQGAVVASTQCFGTSRRLALAPVADWVRHPAVRSATETLDPAWRAEVDRLVPSRGRLEEREGEREGEREATARAMVDAWQRHRFFEGLARALIAVDRPMLLVLDNVQWCDQETLTFLTFCLGLAPEAPILVAGTLRNDSLDEDPELVDWTVRMRAAGLLTELSLSPLEAADTARLAEAISGRRLDRADTGLLQATTGGFPLHIIEAVRGSIDLGRTPLAVGDLTGVLRHRLEQATPTAREVAGLAAAVGTNFTLDLLTEASDLEADTVVAAVDELWQRRIVREFRDGYDFAHDLLRETAYAQVSPPRRWLLHRRVAQGLELLHAADTDLVSAQLAEQYARGGRTDRAVAYYRRAADVAAGMFAHTEAIRLHQEALSLVRGLPEGRSRDTLELAVLEAMAAPLNARHGYASPELQQALERSIALAESLGRKDAMLTGLAGLWASRFVQGRTGDGYRTAVRALSLVGPDSELSGPAHFGVGGSAVSLGRPAEGLRHLQLAAQLASGAVSLSIGTRPDVHSTAFAAHANWLLGHDEQARSSCLDAIGLAREIEHPYSLAVALAYGSVTHQMRHDMAALRDTVGELCELCERYGFAYYREWGLILDGWSRTDRSGLGLARRGIHNLTSEGSFARMPYWLSLLADLLARDGRPDAARAALDAALVAGQARDDLWWLPEVARMRAAYDSDEAAAVSRLRSAARMASAHGSTALLRRCERDLAEHGVRIPTADAPPAC